MITKTYINPMLKKSLLVIIVLFLVLFVLINFATIRTAEIPINSSDSKSNNTFISDYKLLDSVIKINEEEYKIKGIWSAYGIASVSNIFIRTDVENFAPQFIINIDDGFQFITEFDEYRFLFPDFSNKPSYLKGSGIEGDFIFHYKLLYSDTSKLKSIDTVRFHIIDPQGILVDKLNLIRISN